MELISISIYLLYLLIKLNKTVQYLQFQGEIFVEINGILGELCFSLCRNEKQW